MSRIQKNLGEKREKFQNPLHPSPPPEKGFPLLEPLESIPFNSLHWNLIPSLQPVLGAPCLKENTLANQRDRGNFSPRP